MVFYSSIPTVTLLYDKIYLISIIIVLTGQKGKDIIGDEVSKKRGARHEVLRESL
jgi:hypothetical protein